MAHRTLLVVGESPAVGPLLDLLHLLCRQQLVEPVLVAIPGRPSFISTGLDPRDEALHTGDLSTFERGNLDRFTVCHLVLSDGVDGDRSAALAYEVEQRLSNAASLVGQEFHQRVNLVNLLAAAPAESSVRERSGLEGDHGNWINVLLMPEVQERSDLAAAPVRLNDEYIANVATGLASVLSLWTGQHAGSEPDLLDRLDVGASPFHWHLVRTRSRTLSATELPDMVLSDVTHTILLDSPRGDLTLERIPERDADRTVAFVRGTFASRYSLVAVEPPPAGRKRQRVISVREFISMVARFIVSIPVRIAEWFVSWLVLLKGMLLRQLDRLVRTDQLNFRFSPHEEATDSDPGSDRRVGTLDLVSAAADANPAMWAELRQVSFGLLDGGTLPDEYASQLHSGSTRFVLPDPRYVVSAPVGDVATDPQAFTPPELPDPEQWEHSPRAFVDGIVKLLLNESQRAREITESLTARADEIEREHEEKMRRRNSGGWFRRLLRRVWRVLRILLLVAAVVAGVLLLPLLAGAVAGIVILAAQILLVVAVLAWIRRVLVRWFRDDHLLPGQLPQVVDLRRRAQIAQRQVDRLTHLGLLSREWMAIIQSVIHHPFGPPIVTQHNRIRKAELHLPASHKVEDAVISEMRLEGVVTATRHAVFRLGWLQDVYSESFEHAIREHAVRAPGLAFDPDNDRTRPGERQQASRFALREALQSGRAMRVARHDLSRRIHSMLSTGEELPVGDERLEDWLFTRTEGGVEPSQYLNESVLGVPSAWNRGSIQLEIGSANTALDVGRIESSERDSHPIPPSLSAEDMDEGVELSLTPLQFRSSVVEMTMDVPEDQLKFFSATPQLVGIDISIARDLWRVPPDWDEGEVVELPQEERDRWGIDGTELAEHDELITPRGTRPTTSGKGQFAFMLEVGGRPVALASRRVQYKVRTSAAPPNAAEIVRWVLQTTSDVTGLEFEYIGTREDLPGPNEMFDYVFLGWSFKNEFERYEAENGHKAGSTIGLGGPHPTMDPSGLVVLQGGSAILNAEMALPHDLVPGPSHALVLLHELGHVLNLSHVPSTREVMHPMLTDGGPSTWGVGDIQGLRMVVDPALQSEPSAA